MGKRRGRVKPRNMYKGLMVKDNKLNIVFRGRGLDTAGESNGGGGNGDNYN